MRHVIVLALLAGCAPTNYSWTPSSRRVFPERARECEFEVLASNPDRPYDEIGELEHYNGDMQKNLEDFKRTVAEQVCGVGGDGVYVTRDNGGAIAKGTVIKFTPQPQR